MKAIKRFLICFCTAGTLCFLGLDLGSASPKQMILITGCACGIMNMLFYWLEKD